MQIAGPLSFPSGNRGSSRVPAAHRPGAPPGRRFGPLVIAQQGWRGLIPGHDFDPG